MVSVTPDEATITAQVSLVDRDAGKAQARASKEVDAMLSAIKSFSLKPDSLNARAVVAPRIPVGSSNRSAAIYRLPNYSNYLFHHRRNRPFGSGLERAANAGATLISSPVMGSSKHKRQGRSMVKAVKDARKKLTLLAGAADMSLTSLTQISAIAPFSPRPQPTMMRAEMALDSGSSNTFVPGNLTFVAEVRAQADAE